MEDEKKYIEFYENARFPVIVFDLFDKVISPVKVIEYNISPNSGATEKTILAITGSKGERSRSSVDYYFLTREEAEKELKRELKLEREYCFNEELKLSDDLFDDEQWKNCKTFGQRFDLLISRAKKNTL